ncbi:MAG: non-hydrolyzing UDP-N-acetylglucosamine 2-epimerase [bacterium]
MKEIWCVIGTRPEVIKMAPVIHALKDKAKVKLIATAQHRELLDQMLGVFDLELNDDLNLMTNGQTLTRITCKVLKGMGYLFKQYGKPNYVLIQGDTTTVMATALACYYENVKVGHVEAGLRSGNMRAPFPEEGNRKIAGIFAYYHFAPTEWAANNLRKEGILESRIFVTGNTVVDALYYTLKNNALHLKTKKPDRPYILMTCHRRENFGRPVRNIFSAIRQIAEMHPEIDIVYPVHPNPNIVKPAQEILGNLANVKLLKPLDYVNFVNAMQECLFLISDSGGVQEEATALGKRVLVLRTTTERPEAVDAGFCKLVGSDIELIIKVALTCITNSTIKVKSLYGDGQAATRIADILMGS